MAKNNQFLMSKYSLGEYVQWVPSVRKLFCNLKTTFPKLSAKENQTNDGFLSSSYIWEPQHFLFPLKFLLETHNVQIKRSEKSC